MENLKQASEVILEKIKETADKELFLKQKELYLIQKDGELVQKESAINEKIKKYTIDPSVVEEERIRNSKENKRLTELAQLLSIREGKVSEQDEKNKKTQEDIEARFKDIAIRENDIRNKEIIIAEERKTLRDSVEKEVFDKIMKK